jgi:transposase
MFYLRTIKTASGATAIQVVKYNNRKRIIVKHIGSAHNAEEINSLKQTARKWIEQETRQQYLFPQDTKPSFTPIEKCVYLDTRYSFIYDVLFQLLRLLHFDKIGNKLLMDLVIMRIIQPLSKLESLEYLFEMFGIVYKRGKLYQAIASFSTFKDTVEEKAVEFAKQNLSFDFSIVFYDVTTLYFESFKEDEDVIDTEGNVTEKGLRKDGFSKDLKFSQPQIVIGLIVTSDGFPVSYEVFEGNTFEGDTFIPAILRFKKKYKIKILTVVADAAMISLDNVKKLKQHKLSYIVGARLANMGSLFIKKISEKLNCVDGAADRERKDCGTLVYDFSLNRYKKDKREMEKQIIKAKWLVEKNTEGKRTKFLKLKNTDKNKEKVYELNNALIEKTTNLLGLKGYYTNLSQKQAVNKTIIDQYHSLWHVEKAFRIAKSDLQMRPIYHFKKPTIEAHILICFMALAVCKYMELQTGKSTKKIIKMLKSITEAKMKNLLTGKIFVMRKEVSEEVNQLWKTLLP